MVAIINLNIMTPIPLTFTKSDWHHQQICRTEKFAMYLRWKDTSPGPHYEVFEIGQFQESEMHGSKIEAHEFYPGATAFGKTAWTYPTLNMANVKYAELTKVLPKKIIKKIPQ